MWTVWRFFWISTRGSRLRPWRSPYLRWRMETFSGIPAETIGFLTFLRFTWRERRRLCHFFAWCGEMSHYRRASRHPALSGVAGPGEG